MRWAPPVEKPEVPGLYYVWHSTGGRFTAVWDGIDWSDEVDWWLQADTCKHQGADGVIR